MITVVLYFEKNFVFMLDKYIHASDCLGIPSKRKAPDHLLEPEKVRRKLGIQANIMVPNQEILVHI